MAWFTTDEGKHVNTEWFDEDEKRKYKQLEQNKQEADAKNGKSSKIDETVLKKFPKKTQSKITFAEKDDWGKYHVTVQDEKYGEASFHDTNFGNLKWEINEFLKDGSRF